jgi:PAS domain S-box-containing protein
MIVDTGAYTSPYYAGLNLVFLGFCVILQQATYLMILHSLVLYIIYIGCVVIFNESAEGARIFFANNMFVVSTMAIVFLASRVDRNLRYREYKGRKDLEELQAQLQRYVRHLEYDIAESEEKYRILVEHADEAIFVVQDNVMKLPNPKAVSLFGFDAEQLSKMAFSELIAPEDKGLIVDKYRQLQEGRGIGVIPPFRILNKKGQILWVEMTSVLIRWKGSPVVLHVIRDVTERKRIETEIAQLQKMEAIGTLAGGIAHDFNNILQGITGYVQLSLMKRSPNDPDYYYLVEIDKSAKRAAKLINQLLIYSRDVEMRLEPMNLNDEITQTCALLKRVLPKMIIMDLRLAEDLRKIQGDPIQLEQIIMNLAVNARDAMPEGGRLVIETRNVHREDIPSADKVVDNGEDYVLVQVSDTGFGMKQETLERIFDPFYTTKKPGEGTGLGLATVYSIVQNHGGYITCNSEPGRGTTFRFYFPAASSESGVEGFDSAIQEEFRGNQETILLVDDERDILETVREILEKYDYRVFAVESGEKAIEIFLENKDIIDLVILDLNMPKLRGDRCLERLRTYSPNIKVIIATGYLDGGENRTFLESRASGFIIKPYGIADLLKMIKGTLA